LGTGHFSDRVCEINNDRDAIPRDLRGLESRIWLIGHCDLSGSSFHQMNGPHRAVPFEVDRRAGMQPFVRLGQILHDRQFGAIACDEDATGEGSIGIAEEPEPTTEQ